MLSLGAAEATVASTVGLSALEYLQCLHIPFPPLFAVQNFHGSIPQGAGDIETHTTRELHDVYRCEGRLGHVQTIALVAQLCRCIRKANRIL